MGKKARICQPWTPPETESERYLRGLDEERKEASQRVITDVEAQVEAFLASPDRFAVLYNTKTDYQSDFVTAVVERINSAPAVTDLSFFTSGSGCHDYKALIRKG